MKELATSAPRDSESADSKHPPSLESFIGNVNMSTSADILSTLTPLQVF